MEIYGLLCILYEADSSHVYIKFVKYIYQVFKYYWYAPRYCDFPFMMKR